MECLETVSRQVKLDVATMRVDVIDRVSCCRDAITQTKLAKRLLAS